jgi:hypothetical protein
MRDLDRQTNRALWRGKAVFARLMVTAALVLGLGVGGAASPATAYDEGTIVSLANQARAQNGLGGLVRNGSLDAVALNWANQMAASGTLSHNPSVGSQIPGGWRGWGENVAQGYGSGAAVHNGWMNSSGHRANILGNFTDIGTALIEANGTTWAVQVFANYPGSGLPAPAPPAPAPAPAAPAPAPAAPAAPAPVPAEPLPAEQAAADQVAADQADAAAAAAADEAAAAEAAEAEQKAAAVMTPSPAPSPTHAVSSAPTPGPQASESAPLSNAGPWVAFGAFTVAAAIAALWPWTVSRLRQRRAIAGPDPGVERDASA